MIVTVLLVIHGLLAVLLLGALTHQTIGVWRLKPLTKVEFFVRLANVRATSYTNTILALYLLVMIGGGIIYPTYVLDIKSSLTDARMLSAIGAFEIKEHFAVIGLALLPSYWYFWQRTGKEHTLVRKLNTTLLSLLVWWNFLVGHILNNIKGMI
ncbi:MAG: hypothetical protein GY916_04405 [Gammaproteobacteria bacterium]|nr:hypothetical protein [Gammaproteobacteria bacterium]